MEDRPIWEQFLYRFSSFEYVLGVDEVTEQLFSAEEAVERSVRSAYEETLNAQIPFPTPSAQNLECVQFLVLPAPYLPSKFSLMFTFILSGGSGTFGTFRI